MGGYWAWYIDGIGAGFYLLFGLSRLDLWRREVHRPANLWLAVLAFSALLVNVTGRLLGEASTAAPPVLVSLNFLGVGAVTVAILEVVLCLARRDPPRWLRVVESILLILAAGTGAYGGLVVATEMLSAVMLLAALGAGISASLRGDVESRLLLGGIVVLVLCLVLDLGGELGMVSRIPGVPILGFVVLFLLAAHAVNRRLLQEESASRTDPLTGILNRRGFLEMAHMAVSLSDRSGRPLSVIAVDLDRFKDINDRYGHTAGDRVLQEVARTLSRSVREQDLVARLGGDELVVLLPDTDAAGARRVAEKLREAAGAATVEIDGGSLSVTISLGTAERRPGEPIARTIQRADHALYLAKERGRDRVAAAEDTPARSRGDHTE